MIDDWRQHIVPTTLRTNKTEYVVEYRLVMVVDGLKHHLYGVAMRKFLISPQYPERWTVALHRGDELICFMDDGISTQADAIDRLNFMFRMECEAMERAAEAIRNSY